MASDNYAEEVRRQIREKEQLRVKDRNNFFEEGIKLDEEARMRRAKLDDVKRKKLEALRCVMVVSLYGIYVLIDIRVRRDGQRF